MHRNLSLWILGLVIVGASGCGSRHFDVTGKVTYNGTVLDKPDGQIVFIGPKGDQVIADIERDGTYQATEVSAGLNHVVVYYPNPKAADIKAVKLKKEKAPRPKPREPASPTEPPFLTPFKYAVADTSELSVTVEKRTVFDVALTGPEIR